MTAGLSWDISSACWRAAKDIARDFVKHRHPDNSPAKIWHINEQQREPAVSIIIPTSDADRGGYFAKLLGQLQRQTLDGLEVVVIRGDSRQGRAINIGASVARGQYLITLDDDTDLPDSSALEKLIDALARNSDIGIAGGNALIPPDASSFIKTAMKQIPRRAWAPVLQITDSDLAQHPCLAIRADEFKAIGGENELLPRGLDPYLRQQIRSRGKRVVLVPDVCYYHLIPPTLPKLIRQFFRNGRQSAFVTRHYPQWVIETPDTHGEFAQRKSIAARLLRFPKRLVAALIKGQWIWLVSEASYGIGFLYEQFIGARKKDDI